MCLWSRQQDVDRFLEDNKDKDMIKVYKHLCVNTDYGEKRLVSPFRDCEYKAGETIVLKSASTKNRRRVAKGFHCYLEPRNVGSDKLVECYVKPTDIVGRCGDHAVFKSVVILERDYKKAIGRKR